MTDIGIDTREQYKEFFCDELTKLGHECDIVKLDAGDFIVYGDTEENAILIERKDDSDFLGSVQGNKDPITGVNQEGRIWDQLKRMSETGLRRYLLIDGNIYSKKLTAYRKKGWDKPRLWAVLDGITKYGMAYHMTKNREESIEWLSMLINKQNKPKKVFSLRVSVPRDMPFPKKQEYLLQGMPGIGPIASESIMDEYLSLDNAFNNIETWSNLKGIGSKTVSDAKQLWYTSRKI